MSSTAETAGAEGRNLTAVGLIKVTLDDVARLPSQAGEVELKYGGAFVDGSRYGELV
jgi:hypothetical protein